MFVLHILCFVLSWSLMFPVLSVLFFARLLLRLIIRFVLFFRRLALRFFVLAGGGSLIGHKKGEYDR